MIKQFIVNTALSITIIFILFVLDCWFLVAVKPVFYITPLFYFILYTVQNLLLNTRQQKPPMFVLAYNLSTFIKLILSALFMIIYYVFFAVQLANQEKIQFSLFFIGLYFLYLILNTVAVFFYSNEKK